jgi:quinoprotein glucose dehydrogenase
MSGKSHTTVGSALKRRLFSFGGWLTLIMGITVLIFGLPMFLMGIHLIALGGSWYYAIAGAFFTVAAVQILREKRRGYWTYFVTFAATIVWAFWEVGPSPWGLLPRVLTFLVIALVCWATWPLIDRRLQPQGADPKLVRDLDRHLGFLGSWQTAVISAVAIIVVGGTSALVFPGPSTDLPDSVETPADYAFHTAAMPADPTPPGEWQNYGRVPGGQRFSPLNQITPANVGQLQRAWTFHTGAVQGSDEGLPRRFAFESTPLAVRGKLIMCTPHAEVIAVDSATGREVWRFNPKSDIRSQPFMICRGVSYHETPGAQGPCAHRIMWATMTARLYALDADTGQRCAGFGGPRGEVDLTAGMGLVTPGFYYVSSPPSIVGDVAVMGGWVYDNVERGEPSGVVRAFDVHTGKLAWAMDVGRLDRKTLPPPGEQYTRGTINVWSPISADPALGLVYLPTGNETPDFFGGGRLPSSDKYSSSVIAVDAKTGDIRWHFQTVHHDIWDQDIAAQPLLVDFPETPGARPTPAVLVSTKSGQTFVLDRRTGRPLVPVTERRVPQGAVAGDFTSPTQPYSGFPSLAPADFTEKSMWGVFPIDQLECRIKFHRSSYEGAFTPPSTAGSILLPGSLGVYEWGSASVDPVHGIMYANTSWTPMLTRLIPQLKYRGHPTSDDVGGYGLGTPYGSTVLAFLSSLGAPCIQPPWGHMTAIDLAAHRVLWRRPLGSFLGMTVGLPNMGGGAVTAGGVIFQGATPDSTFRAIDAKTGKVLWSDKLPANANATPVVYQGADGRQYVAIAAGGHAGMGPTGDTVVAYALPGRP